MLFDWLDGLSVPIIAPPTSVLCALTNGASLSATTITVAPVKVADLPGKGDELNHHWTKSLVASADGAHLYVGVGSNSNVAERDELGSDLPPDYLTSVRRDAF